MKTDLGKIYNVELAKEAIALDIIRNARIVKKPSGRIVIEKKLTKKDNNTDFPEYD